MLKKNSGLPALAIGLFVLQLVGCSTKKETAQLSYQFEANGCPTGKHTFSDQASYCQALKDDAVNNYCARSLRREDFKARCSGSFDEPIDMNMDSLDDLTLPESETFSN